MIRWGLDLGATSLGWCVLEIGPDGQPASVIDSGVRIFRDGRHPKDGSSYAAKRRAARSQRRNRDRYLARRKRLMKQLIQHGLMPEDGDERKALVGLDPFELRARGLGRALPLYHLGRAIFHLNQRRGFKSNRKADSSDGDDGGKVKSAITQVQQSMTDNECRTVGEWLHMRHQRGEGVRARRDGVGISAPYELYVGRDMIAHEFDVLWAAQAGHHGSALSQAAYDDLRDTLLHQRPLKPVEPGPCTLNPSEKRAPLALPSTQRFRILQELANLRVINHELQPRPLTLDERRLLAAELECKNKVTFGGMRKLLGLRGTYFNLESAKRKDLKGNLTSVLFASKNRFGGVWHEMDPAEQEAIAETWLSADLGDEALKQILIENHGLDDAHAAAVATARLPDGHSHLGRTAIRSINEQLLAGADSYDVAVRAAGYESHSGLSHGQWHERLPDYRHVLVRHLAGGSGNPDDPFERRAGRITNPTVHIGLNQLRTVGNALIERYGVPDEICVELARELKLSEKRRKEIEKQQAERQKENDGYRDQLRAMNLPVNRENIARFRLWNEINQREPLQRLCVYTGERINKEKLFSTAVEIDHILPRADSLDDSLANKVLCVRNANRDKGKQTPFDAFHDRPGYDWNEITERAQALPRNKSWRFSKDAMKKLAEDSDFLGRHLTDTQYFSKVAKEYLSTICPQQKIDVTPGRLTGLLRGKWGLSKTRDDHRHHAVDAIVVGVTTRGMLQQVSRAAAAADEAHLDRFVSELPTPWDGFHSDVTASIDRIAVSYKPDHGPQGQLHDDTAYGLAEGADGRQLAVHRVELTALTTDKKIAEVRDAHLRTQLLKATAGKTGAGFKQALVEFGRSNRVRRIRVERPLALVKITRDGTSESAYKGYKGNSNYSLEIYRDEKEKWRSETVSTFDANRLISELGVDAGMAKLRDTKRDQRGRPLVMRLCTDDTIAIGESGARVLYRVVSTRTSGKIELCQINEANADARNRSKEDSLSFVNKMAGSLQTSGGRRVFIDPIGRVLDPGPQQ